MRVSEKTRERIDYNDKREKTFREEVFIAAFKSGHITIKDIEWAAKR